MKPYVIKQGDYLSKLALSMGFDPDEVWNHSKNAGIKSLRKNREILAAGDVLYVPDEEPKPLDLKVGSSNTFKAVIPTVDVNLVFKDSEGKPRSGVKYWAYGLGDTQQGALDGDGKLKLSVPVNVALVKLVFEGEAMAHNIRVGHMDPVEEKSGVRQRLIHLGYHVDMPGSRDDDARISDALSRFQTANGLSVTGKPDPATRAKLIEAHGC